MRDSRRSRRKGTKTRLVALLAHEITLYSGSGTVGDSTRGAGCTTCRKEMGEVRLRGAKWHSRTENGGETSPAKADRLLFTVTARNDQGNGNING
jgi:hypothetical protein